MEFLTELNWLAIGISVIAGMAVGFWWYSKPAFGNMWLKLNNISDEEVEAAKGKSMHKELLCGLIIQFILVGSYNFIIWATGINPYCIAALVVIGFIAPMLAVASNWEKRPWGLFWINLGHWVVVFAIVSIIFGLLNN